MPALEGRSVGELLLDWDLLVREVLMDTAQMDGRVMVRTWGEVVEAAGDLWRALPEPSPAQADPSAEMLVQVLMEQLQTMNGEPDEGRPEAPMARRGTRRRAAAAGLREPRPQPLTCCRVAAPTSARCAPRSGRTSRRPRHG